MPTEVQTLPGGTNFTGIVGAGLFNFSTRFSNLSRSTRIVINSVAYTEIKTAFDIQTNVRVQITRPGGGATEYAIVGNGIAAENLIALNDAAELRLCGLALYREPGDGGLFWDLQVFSEMKLHVGTVSVDYLICPFPETDERDSQP